MEDFIFPFSGIRMIPITPKPNRLMNRIVFRCNCSEGADRKESGFEKEATSSGPLLKSFKRKLEKNALNARLYCSERKVPEKCFKIYCNKSGTLTCRFKITFNKGPLLKALYICLYGQHCFPMLISLAQRKHTKDPQEPFTHR